MPYNTEKNKVKKTSQCNQNEALSYLLNMTNSRQIRLF